MKKIIIAHCEKIIVEEKDLKEGIYKKKGEEFEWEVNSQLKFPSFFEDLFLLKGTQIRRLWKRYKLQENIVLKYTICPICGEKIWMDEPYNGHWILKGGWKLTGVFETQTLRVCPTEQIICVKEDLLRKSPNSLTRTFLNANINRNNNRCLTR